MKYIILCADDYAQNPAITQGILNLVSHNRLSAISCLTTSPYWKKHAAYLAPFQDSMDIGLHFNLTEGFSITSNKQFNSMPQLLLNAFLYRLDVHAIEAEFMAQLDRFIEYAGKMPDFIDGHQHIHHFPVIRQVLLRAYQKRLLANKTYIRIASNSPLQSLLTVKCFPKTQIIALTGALTFKKNCQQLNIPFTHSFAGIYSFGKAVNYPTYFRYFLSQVRENGLIMCHPGLATDDKKDALHDSRPKEYAYFISNSFINDCAEAGVSLGRYSFTK
jgi:hypothetical protein